MDLNLNHLRSFMSVARLGNLSAAAKELNVTQPHLGRQMTALANEVGLELFSRHSRGLDLTKQGEEFFLLCQDIIGQITQKTNSIREKSSEVCGTLKIIVGVGAGQIILDHLSTLSQQFPNLCFDISTVGDIFQLKVGKADVGILPDEISDPDLIQLHLYDMDIRMYASPSYLAGRTQPKTLKDLYSHNIVLYKAGTEKNTRLLNLHLTGDSTKDAKYNTFVTVNHGLALRKALLNGYGIGTIYYESDLVNQKLLVDVFPHLPSRRIPHYLTFHRRLEDSPKIHVFYNFMKELAKPFQLVVPN